MRAWLGGGTALLALLLAACQTTGARVVANGEAGLRQAGANVVTDWAGLAFTAPLLDERQDLVLDERAQIFDDGKHRRYVRGYVLPAPGKAYAITLTSFRQGTPGDPAILYPELVFLDAERHPLQSPTQVRFDYRSGMDGADGLHTTVFLNSDRRERYMVVTSRSVDQAELARAAPNTVTSAPVSVAVRGGFLTWMIPRGHMQAPTRMIAAPTGRIAITFAEYRLRKVGE